VDTLHRRWSFCAIFSPAHAAGVFGSGLAQFLENAKPKIQSVYFHFQTFIRHHSLLSAKILSPSSAAIEPLDYPFEKEIFVFSWKKQILKLYLLNTIVIMAAHNAVLNKPFGRVLTLQIAQG
jgi:hypothetical protein